MAYERRTERVVEEPDLTDDTTVVDRSTSVRNTTPETPPVAGPPAYVQPRTYVPWGYQVNRFIWYLFGLLEGLLALRFILRAIAANPDNPFAAFIYQLSGLFVAPFRTLVREPRFDGAVLEVTTLIAMLVYLLIAYAVTRLIQLLSDRTYA